MRQYKKYSILIAIILLIVFTAGCATLQGKKAYLAALKKYTQTAEKYEAYYQAASETQKAKWKETIDPVMLEASAALDVWGLAIINDTESNEEQLYNEIFSKLLPMLIEAGVIEVKEN